MPYGNGEDTQQFILERPKSVTDAIDQAYEVVSKSETSEWPYNGQVSSYGIMGIDEFEFIKNRILKSYPSQKIFYFFDPGAGIFQLSRHLTKLLNNDLSIPVDVKINFISVRGEKLKEPEANFLREDIFSDPIEQSDNKIFVYHPNAAKVTYGKCTNYYLGAFKLECMALEFSKFIQQGTLDFPDIISIGLDAAFSHFTLNHLVDGLGTLIQLFNMLKNGGVILSDGITMSVIGQDAQNHSGLKRLSNAYVCKEKYISEDDKVFRMARNAYLMQALLEFGRGGHRFLFRDFASGPGDTCEFYLERQGRKPFNLPYRYKGIAPILEASARKAKLTAVFEPAQSALSIDDAIVFLIPNIQFSGCESLYRDLCRANVFDKSKFANDHQFTPLGRILLVSPPVALFDATCDKSSFNLTMDDINRLKSQIDVRYQGDDIDTDQEEKCFHTFLESYRTFSENIQRVYDTLTTKPKDTEGLLKQGIFKNKELAPGSDNANTSTIEFRTDVISNDKK